MGNLGSYRGTSSTEYDDSYTDDGVSLGRSRLPLGRARKGKEEEMGL